MKEKQEIYSFAFLVILSSLRHWETFVAGMKNYHTDNISINQRQEINIPFRSWWLYSARRSKNFKSSGVKIKDSEKSLTIYLICQTSGGRRSACMENYTSGLWKFCGDRKPYLTGRK